MSLNPTAFRRAGIGLTTAAALAIAALLPAHAQSVLAANPPSGGSGVSPAQCAAFGKYLTDEARAFKKDMSRTFLVTSARFLRSGCAAFDKDGEIQIITETLQDGASLRTARRLMGKYDILGNSGVAHCDRPPNGVCPTRTGANAPKAGAGGG